MTLDPVHFDGIARLARRIEHRVDEAERRDLAERAWTGFLDPLRRDGRVVLEPLDGLRRDRLPIERTALEAPAFPTRHGLDSGTINPRTFRNGLVLDVAQAAMASTPSDLDLHRSRTVVAAVHANDATVRLADEWETFDDGYSRGRIVHVPRVGQFEGAVVHSLALYLAESSHALDHAGAVSDLLVLDGPLYPKGMVNWLDRHPELAGLLSDADLPRSVVANYLRLVERFAARDVPLLGFVKNPSGRAVRNALDDAIVAPWADDAGFLRAALSRPDGPDGPPAMDAIVASNWFAARGGPDRVFAADGDALGLDRALPAGAYEVTFFAVYDPRTELVYTVEAPAAFTRDADRRERLRRHVVRAVAATRGPPRVVTKADALARIGGNERASLIEAIERTFETERAPTYDRLRWGDEY